MLRVRIVLSVSVFGGSALNHIAVLLEINSDDMCGRSYARKAVMDRLALGSWVEATFADISRTLDRAVVTKVGGVVLL